MAPHSMHNIVLLVLCLTVAAVTTAHSLLTDFRADLNHPYAGSSLSTDDVIIHAARASKARAARINARLARVLGNLSAAEVPVAPQCGQGHTLTVGIGTPPQPRNLIVDTGSDLIWTLCSLSRSRRTATATARQQREPPLYKPRRSSSFSFLPCSDRLCQEQEGKSFEKNCTSRNRCRYDAMYGSAAGDGVLASETFTFGVNTKVSVPLAFGCGHISQGSLDGASGVMGLSPGIMSLVSQLSVPRFSYCFTPFAERKTSPLLFGAMADLDRHKTTGAIQTTSILGNPEVHTAYYYVPLVGLSLGTKRLDVPASSLAIKADGSGGTVVDSGSTIMYLVKTAFRAVRKAVVEAVRLPVVNRPNIKEYELCFALPSGVELGAVKTPPLVLHFDGGAAMLLPRDNYFQEPRAGLMCLAVGTMPDGFGVSAVIGNVQQQNMHVLFDVHNQKFSFAPTKCDDI